jgi:hypothetical protein
MVLVGLGFLAALMCCPRRGGLRRTPAAPKAPMAAGASDRDWIVVARTWKDPNAPALSGAARTCSQRIGRRRLLEVMNSFGVSPSRMTLRYSNEAEKEAETARLDAYFHARGFRLKGGEGKVIEPDYQWMIDSSRRDCAPLCRELVQWGQAHRRGSDRELFGLASSLVQSLEYRIPPDVRTNPDGQVVHVGGITMPLETLANGWGDCDTRCVLLASILGSLKGARCALLLGDRHAFLGLQLSPEVGDRYILVQGEPYVLVELTDAWPLGALSEDTWERVQGNAFLPRILE